MIAYFDSGVESAEGKNDNYHYRYQYKEDEAHQNLVVV